MKLFNLHFMLCLVIFMTLGVCMPGYRTFAQALATVKGQVTDTANLPLPGVTVQLVGTKSGVITKPDGTFSIDAPVNAILRFNYMGYIAQDVPVNGQKTITVTLKENNNSLNDVVVVGYGTKKKRDLTGNVATLDSKEIANARSTNAQEAMQGRLAGVDVKRSSGKPGSNMTIEIRGANSITGSTQPLYVVDGIPVPNSVSGINDINPLDIDRIDVLKDASSTAIYGSRGANGVVIVTTKKGTQGKAKISYDANVGMVNGYNIPKMMNGTEFVAYAREYYNTQAAAAGQTTPVDDSKIFSATELNNIKNGTYTNWIDAIKQNGFQTSHNISITGSDDKNRYFLSAGFQDYGGTVKVENTKKYTLKLGMERKVAKWLNTGASMYGTWADYNMGPGEAFRSAYRLRPTGSAYNTDGSLRFYTSEAESQITNPLFDFDNDLRRNQYVHVMPNVFAEVNLPFGIKFRSSFTPDITFQRNGTYTDQFSKGGAGTKPNSATNSAYHYVNYTMDDFLSYGKEIGKHKFDVLAGTTQNYYQYDYSTTSVSGLPYRSLWYNMGSATAVTINGNTIQPSTVVSSGYTKQTLNSVLARANYSYDNKYLLTVTARNDWNSIFAQGNKSGFFPSAGAAWVISEEHFMKNQKTINFLKLKLSYGTSGNASSSTYLGPYVTQTNVTTSWYDWNGNNANGFVILAQPDAKLTWEKTREVNLGLEMALLKSRITLSFDYYNKKSKGSILQQQIPIANGYPTIVTNLGSVLNRGIEVVANTRNIVTNKFKWSTSVNFAKNHNEILELYGDGKDDITNARFIGQKSRVVYNYKVLGVWQTSEAEEAAKYGQKPGQYKIEDVNGDGKITTDDRQVLGSDIPDWFGGITNTFNYGNFDFSFTIYTRQGTFQQSTFVNKYVNDDQGRARFNSYSRDYWTTTNPSNTWANNAIETDANRKQAREYMNSSYTKISNITLGYTFPEDMLKKAGFTNLRIYATAVNPFIFTSFVGWDPETASLDTYGLQSFKSRTFMFGLSLGL